MNNQTQSLKILRKLTSNFSCEGKKYSEIVTELWQGYVDGFDSNNNLNGAVFEEIIGYTLTISGCVPFYMQAKIAYVPNVNYDFICFDAKSGPLSISAKTSLRERWKQADLEAVALKYVHRNATSYLVTLDEKASQTRIEKLGECMGLNDFILATSSRYDEMIEELKKKNLSLAGSVQVITSNIVIDERASKDRYGG